MQVGKINKILDNLEELHDKTFILSHDEKEVAIKLLETLEGQTVIRATTILKFTLELIKFSVIEIHKETAPKVPVQEQSILELIITDIKNRLKDVNLKVSNLNMYVNRLSSNHGDFEFEIKFSTEKDSH